MKMFTPEQYKTAMERSIAFFEANPEKWTTGIMQDRHGDCRCMAGQMAVELGLDP